MPSTFVIGDIHGCNRLLRQLLDQMAPDLKDSDTVVFLGDYIDRGPDSKGVIATLLAFRKGFPGRTVCLKGNHEQAFLETITSRSLRPWLLPMEGMPTLKSYDPTLAKQLQRKQFGEPEDSFFDTYEKIFSAEHMQFLSGLSPFYENESVICVHGGLDPNLPMGEQNEQTLLWTDPRELFGQWTGPKTLCVGHKNVQRIRPGCALEPLMDRHMICLDTGSASTGILSAVRLPDRKVYQARSRWKWRL